MSRGSVGGERRDGELVRESRGCGRPMARPGGGAVIRSAAFGRGTWRCLQELLLQTSGQEVMRPVLETEMGVRMGGRGIGDKAGEAHGGMQTGACRGAGLKTAETRFVPRSEARGQKSEA